MRERLARFRFGFSFRLARFRLLFLFFFSFCPRSEFLLLVLLTMRGVNR